MLLKVVVYLNAVTWNIQHYLPELCPRQQYVETCFANRINVLIYHSLVSYNVQTLCIWLFAET